MAIRWCSFRFGSRTIWLILRTTFFPAYCLCPLHYPLDIVEIKRYIMFILYASRAYHLYKRTPYSKQTNKQTNQNTQDIMENFIAQEETASAVSNKVIQGHFLEMDVVKVNLYITSSSKLSEDIRPCWVPKMVSKE